MYKWVQLSKLELKCEIKRIIWCNFRKLIYRYKGKAKYELYNLGKDPFETNNLAESEPSKLKEITKAMVARLEKEDALYISEGGKELKPFIP